MTGGPRPGAGPTAAEACAGTLAESQAALSAGIDQAAHCVGTAAPVVLAVSGGPDSLALLLAAASLRDHRHTDAPQFLVVTVDHGLRPEAAAEAAFVAAIAAAHGLPHRTMRLALPLPPGNVPAAARRGRYDLLLEAAGDAGASMIVTAHHEDDQFETHLHALARKAGPVGLAAMRPVRDLAPGIVLLRPFLGVPGARLKALVAASGIDAVDDPTNHDPRYERTWLRIQRAASGDDHAWLRGDIAQSQRRRDVLEAAQAGFIYAAEASGALRLGDAGVLRVDRQAFRQLDESTAFAFLARALTAVSGDDYAPGGDSVQRLQAALASSSGRVASTLGGAMVDADPDTITFLREFGRSGIATVQTGKAHAALFDGRFLVDVPEGFSPADTRLVAFGSLGRGNPVERTMPVLIGDAGLLAVPAALAAKAPDDLPRLDVVSLVRWRLLRDLPQESGSAVPTGEKAASGFAANAPGRVGKAGDSPYLPRKRLSGLGRLPQED
ncbi:tRNA lysidine(34) synthetase TilS [Aurantimonas aggregata]|uniref:tRNA(Ile)-lysidine synthase n=1 Tax=Aurantimonas aggregata TaxID=2047720 RepID=A0A6L9MHA5_9HYPH|nr:tRNA lysidine(34) synthetase TilS [Aurantimonas aggregata]NDV87214.1 tRNA lysidine(34) synthetase TilS [Aurantimonas aggregata]